MTIEFQQEILSYLVQFPEGLKYVDDLTEELFDLVEYKLCFQLLKKYKKVYNSLPGKVSAIQYVEEQIAETRDFNPQVAKDLREVFEDIYFPLPENDRLKVEDSIIIEVQEKQIDSIFMDHAQGKLSTSQVLVRMNKLGGLVKSSEDDNHSDGGFLIEDREKHYDEQTEGHPTFLHDLNALTAAGGFYSPQLIIFMSGAKSFKTGLLIKLAIEYARGGMKVYYADGENGARSIRNRAKQCIMECSYQELYDGEIQEELNEVLYRFGHMMGGDLYIDSYPAGTKSIGDVKNRLAYLKEEFRWEPDMIIYDSIDHFIPTNSADRSRDIRIKIQLVYHEAIALNHALNTFAFAPSQVNRDALNKKVFDTKDISEDIGKAFNSHGIFGICGSPEEIEAGVRRIIPILQREGVAYKGKNMCVIQIDEERMKIEEVDKNEYLKNITDE
jgi:hypothetical protein